MVVFSLIEAAFLSCILISLLMLSYPGLLKFLLDHRMCRANYQGHQIPVSTGILFPIIHLGLLPLMMGERFIKLFGLQSVALLIVAYVGFKDDQAGGWEAKGLKGHFLYAIRERRISTGLWKAIVVGGVAVVFSAIYSTSWLLFMLDFLLISLSANFINLLDLRPGRAMKGFLILFLPFLFLAAGKVPYILWLSVVIPASFLFYQDVLGKVMLGDAGSNCLGMVLGFWIMLYAPLSFRVFIVILLIGIHYYAEKKSLTIFIQEVKFLQWLDMLGRYEKNPRKET
ncbi:MAG TPA: hypothetical protein VJ824_12340 [Bacillota bacterium]|nr:hypothetical protein [Bacillota bacterium]